MSKKQRSQTAQQLDVDIALAAIIKNTRTSRRHIALPELVHWLETAVQGVGGIREVAERVGVSVQMLQQFLFLKTLSRPVQELFVSRKLDSVDMVVHLRRLPPQDQEIVANEAASGRLNSADVRAICEFRKKYPDTGIQQAIETVKETRNIKQYVIEFVVRKKQNVDELRRRFESVLGTSHIVSLAMRGSIVTLVIDQKGRSELRRVANESECTQVEAVQKIATGQVQT